LAAIGDQWILGIHQLQNPGFFTQYPGVGYAGPQSSGSGLYTSDGYGGVGPDGSARVIWELSGNSVNNGTPVPTSTELYTIEVYGVRDTGRNDWQPVESQFNGAGGETYPIEPNIPWIGQFGTNHQYIGSDGADSGLWLTTGTGPQAPVSNEFNAGGNGSYMWLTSGSWLYAKYDFPWSINRSWSALRLTQVTQNGEFVAIPEPSSVAMTLLGAAAIGIAVRRRQAS
jgi:hypothetical protein